tara:strand:+ start:1670 stop:3289 length:1620 start_codon:yes stop_codon:yes gene_type:complete
MAIDKSLPAHEQAPQILSNVRSYQREQEAAARRREKKAANKQAAAEALGFLFRAGTDVGLEQRTAEWQANEAYLANTQLKDNALARATTQVENAKLAEAHKGGAREWYKDHYTTEYFVPAITRLVGTGYDSTEILNAARDLADENFEALYNKDIRLTEEAHKLIAGTGANSEIFNANWKRATKENRAMAIRRLGEVGRWLNFRGEPVDPAHIIKADKAISAMTGRYTNYNKLYDEHLIKGNSPELALTLQKFMKRQYGDNLEALPTLAAKQEIVWKKNDLGADTPYIITTDPTTNQPMDIAVFGGDDNSTGFGTDLTPSSDKLKDQRTAARGWFHSESISKHDRQKFYEHTKEKLKPYENNQTLEKKKSDDLDAHHYGILALLDRANRKTYGMQTADAQQIAARQHTLAFLMDDPKKLTVAERTKIWGWSWTSDEDLKEIHTTANLINGQYDNPILFKAATEDLGIDLNSKQQEILSRKLDVFASKFKDNSPMYQQRVLGFIASNPKLFGHTNYLKILGGIASPTERQQHTYLGETIDY